MSKKIANVLRTLLGALIITGVYAACAAALKAADSGISASLVSMVALFLLLRLKIVPIWCVEKTADLLLKNMVFFFVPILAVLPATYHIFKGHVAAVLLSLTISAAITIAATGFAVNAVRKILRNKAEPKNQTEQPQ